MVNSFKKYKEQPIEILEQYKNKNIIETYNNFVKVFSARGNIRMLADTMQRNMIMKDFKTWILANKEIFIQPSTILIKTSNTVIADNTVTSKTNGITEHNISDPEPDANSGENVEKVSASIFETTINTSTDVNDVKLSP